MNAVAVDMVSGELLDPQNGLRHAHERTLRAVRFDFPDEPITSGATLTRPMVPFFRALHYAAELRYQIDALTYRWILNRRHYAAFSGAFEDNFFALHRDASAILHSEQA